MCHRIVNSAATETSCFNFASIFPIKFSLRSSISSWASSNCLRLLLRRFSSSFTFLWSSTFYPGFLLAGLLSLLLLCPYRVPVARAPVLA